MGENRQKKGHPGDTFCAWYSNSLQLFTGKTDNYTEQQGNHL